MPGNIWNKTSRRNCWKRGRTRGRRTSRPAVMRSRRGRVRLVHLLIELVHLGGEPVDLRLGGVLVQFLAVGEFGGAVFVRGDLVLGGGFGVMSSARFLRGGWCRGSGRM